MAGWIGVDVGGANLKAADGRGATASQRLPLWREPDRLPAALERLFAGFVDRAGVALTMTGELADCYATKAEGVAAIVRATVRAAGGSPVRVATVDDRWLTADGAIDETAAVAAANWRVAARLVARLRPRGRGVLVDVGSTTVDVVPIADGRVAARGATDTGRLLFGELVYTGVRRTPVCAIADRLPLRGADCPVAAEVFATAADAWLLLGELSEDPDDCDTADGRPLTRRRAVERLARCFCADGSEFGEDDAIAAARGVARRQTDAVAAALGDRRGDWIALSGEGAFLGERAASERWAAVERASLASAIGADATRVLPAHACAVLAAEEIGGHA